MNKEEYKKYAEEHEDWAPGWDAIDECFEKLYPGQEPEHFGTNIISRAMMGGDEYLDGYSIYTSPNGYKHLVTYGMSELYANKEAQENEFSKWGYEMTIKLPVETSEECQWAINMMSNLARYTFTQERWFEPLQFIAGNGQSINWDIESAITALLIVNDTEVPGVNTIHGKLDFMQLVGITEQELQAIKADPSKASVLIELMRKDNPMLITNLTRTINFL
ncbi:suppressor of fused domain protein [Parabacteroides goldsteinii]|uniref:Suppressor of fused-like domain-containing protein n=2 Tax=Parabacteroides goldsteinii TaxID=328812 RepID=K5ZEC2_9BACT|nr:suppressor of fused domain protein [Parabacteroides goldsteinii]EKN09570.1 hypothetical protein HMPREF1076_04174 [Parabacteroides goldsteinii CL02T12C30]